MSGIQVGWFFPLEEHEEDGIPKLRQALAMIELYDARRHARICRDVARIYVWSSVGYRGQWIAAHKMCQISGDYIAHPDTTAVDVALLIVHESTHARISGFGIQYSEPVRGRIERACRREELRFAERIPDPGDHLQLCQQRLMVDTAEYSSKSLFELEAKHMMRLAQEERYPSWLVRFLQRIMRWKARRAGWEDLSERF